MPEKPANLIYGLDDKPPVWTCALLGIQHVFVMSVYFILPVIIVKSIGGSHADSTNMIKMSMIGIGVTTILQSLKKGPVGSGFLCPSGNGPAYLPAQLLAAKTGGLSLVCGMVIAGGVLEALFSRVVSRLRVLFPPEVAGLVILMVGVELVLLGITRFFFGQNEHVSVEATNFSVAFITLAVMIGFNIWAKGWLRLYPILIGMVSGYATAYVSGILTRADMAPLLEAPFIALPHFAVPGISFDIALLLPVAIATLCSSLKDIGDLTTCQKINDSEWKRCDMKTISRGILADSIGDIFSGLIGGLGQTTSSSNVGLSVATRATSRRIGYATGIILCILAFCPKLAAVFAIMPQPVMGAILIFVSNFMILAGIQMIATRMLDTRKIFVVGTSLIFGLSIHFFPKAFLNIPAPLQAIFGSGLFLSTFLAVVLNLIFRIGIAKQMSFTVSQNVDALKIVSDTLEKQGAAWGARRDVMLRAKTAVNEAMESLLGLGLARGDVAIDLIFNEMNLTISIEYEGEMMDFENAIPTEADLLENKNSVYKLSGLIIKHHIDHLDTDMKDGMCRLSFHFDH